jgi:hypothetical protein
MKAITLLVGYIDVLKTDLLLIKQSHLKTLLPLTAH